MDQAKADRATPASAKARPDAIQVRHFGPAERRRVAASGWIALLVEVPKGGRLETEARARLGRRVQTVASAEMTVAGPGPVRLRLHLSRAARDRLATGTGFQVRLSLRLAGLPSIRKVSFGLPGAR